MKHLPCEWQPFEVHAFIVVGDGECFGILVKCLELDVLVNALHFRQFTRRLTVGSDDTIVHEVTLVGRFGIVVTIAVLVETIYLQLAVGYIFRRNNSLVYPVPDATTHTVSAAFHNVPVFLEVTYGVTHRVSIFTHEIGFSYTVNVP